MPRRCFALAVGALLAGSSCERTHHLLWPDRDAGQDADANRGDAHADGAEQPFFDGGLVFCGEKRCACSNGEDDDGDGLVDGLDPECTHPYDQDEATFATGEKEGNPFCRDCFFDGNAGPDDDGCNVAASCVLDGTTSISNGSCRRCDPSAECVENCRRLTPNGCDCFGCCQVQSGASTLLVLLNAACSLDPLVLADKDKCPECEPSDECFNPCERCELCLGRRREDLPPDCRDQNDLGFICQDTQVCGAASALCPERAWCIQGCCAPIVL